MKNNNFLYLMIAVLVVTVGILGFVYLAEKDTTTISFQTPDTQINMDVSEDGIKGSIDG